MNLTAFSAHYKCRAHAGVQTCRYLVTSLASPGQFRCGYVDDTTRGRIDGRFLRGYTQAKAGPCDNPYDPHDDVARPPFLSPN